MEATQLDKGAKKKVRNDRLFGTAISKESPESLRTVDLSPELIKQIEHFFVSYNRLAGKKFEMLGLCGPKKARKLVEEAARAFKLEKHKRRD
jgi:inorganic pyrophosphatase